MALRPGDVAMVADGGGLLPLISNLGWGTPRPCLLFLSEQEGSLADFPLLFKRFQLRVCYFSYKALHRWAHELRRIDSTHGRRIGDLQETGQSLYPSPPARQYTRS